MMVKDVKVNGKELKLRYTLRGFFAYEEIMGKPYDNEKTINQYVLLYGMLLGCNPDISLTLDEVIDECDACPELVAAFGEVMGEQLRRSSEMASADEDDDKKKVAP